MRRPPRAALCARRPHHFLDEQLPDAQPIHAADRFHEALQVGGVGLCAQPCRRAHVVHQRLFGAQDAVGRHVSHAAAATPAAAATTGRAVAQPSGATAALLPRRPNRRVPAAGAAGAAAAGVEVLAGHAQRVRCRRADVGRL
eukprot:288884-Chlamydomonas_euryale.AAC.2